MAVVPTFRFEGSWLETTSLVVSTVRSAGSETRQCEYIARLVSVNITLLTEE